MNYAKKSLKIHQQLGGKIELGLKVSLKTADDLATFYTPGVAEPCREIAKNKDKSFDLTWRKNTVAIISDGTAVLGLGDIGPEAALPVMEGKGAIMKAFANVDGIPICIATKDVDEIVKLVKQLEPTFGAINLEDISAPRCFEIEKRLNQELNIPVFHDDQHGTAIVALAGLKNALKLVGKKIEEVKIVFSGAGAGGIATAKLFICAGAKYIIMCDSKGAIYKEREDLNFAKREIVKFNLKNEKGNLQEVLEEADVFIGLSVPNLLKASDIEKMAKNAIVFAMANPTPEIMPEEAKKGGARIVATGRSDFVNQVNNALVFPGLFRGILDIRAKKFTQEMFLVASEVLANFVGDQLHEKKILPFVFEKGLAEEIDEAIKVLNCEKK